MTKHNLIVNSQETSESGQTNLDRTIAKIRRDAEEQIERARRIEAQRIKMAEKRRIEAETANRERVELRARLEDEHGTAGHPKAELLWAKAWEHGHASGHAEVEYWYSDLAELVT